MDRRQKAERNQRLLPREYNRKPHHGPSLWVAPLSYWRIWPEIRSESNPKTRHPLSAGALYCFGCNWHYTTRLQTPRGWGGFGHFSIAHLTESAFCGLCHWGRQQRSTVFLMHSKPNGECARRCLETEALQLSFKKVNLCRGTRQMHTLTRLQAMAPIDGAPKFSSHELLWALRPPPNGQK